MSELVAAVGTFKVDPAVPAETAATGLVEHMKQAGFESRIVRPMRALGLSTVWAGKDDTQQVHVLVHRGGVASMREQMAKFMASGNHGARPMLISSTEPPADVAFLLSDHPLAELERQLADEGIPDLGAPIGALPELVAAQRARIEQASGVALAGSLEEVCEAVDRVVDDLRGGLDPEEHGAEDAVAPVRVLMLLGLVATEAFRDAIGGGRLCSLTWEGHSEIRTLGDAGGFPAVDTGNQLVNVAQKVHKRWTNGAEDSVRFMATIAVRNHRADPPDALPKRESAVDHTPPETAEAEFERLLEVASFAPFAGLMLVAAADGQVDREELDVFLKGFVAADDEILRVMMAGSDVEPVERMRRLAADQELVVRSLAAAGVLFLVPEGGPIARDRFLNLLTDVANADGTFAEEEKQAIEHVRRLLDGGKAVALEGGRVGGAVDELVRTASLAPHALFLVIAATDGEVEKEEVEAYLEGVAMVRNPLLRQILNATDADLGDQVKLLVEHPELGPPALRAASRLFASHAQGKAAREELRSVLARVVSAHGELRAPEQEMLERAMATLERDETLRVAITSMWRAALFLVAGVVLWQVVATLAGLAGVFVPVAVAIQAVVLGWLLWLPAGRASYGIQVIRGTVASLAAALPIGIGSLAVGAVLGSEGSLVTAAMAGVIGTAVTGFVMSLLFAIFLRR